MKFRARISSKKKLETNWEIIDVFLSRFKPGTLLELDIKRLERKESNPMRRYYYSQVLPPLLKATGYEVYEAQFVHNVLKGMFFENHENEEWRTYKDERGIWRNVPHVFAKNSPIPVSVKKEFISFAERVGVKYGAEYDKLD